MSVPPQPSAPTAPRRAPRGRTGPDTPLARASLCVVDLETTGGAPGAAKITEIGAVRIEGLRVVDRFSTLVDPGRPVPLAIARLTGLTDEMLRGAPPIEVALDRFLNFSAGATLVAHNAPFDLRFLNYERYRIEGRYLARPCLDTLALARRLLAGRVARHGLASLAEWAGAEVRPNHRALPDAEATAKVLSALVELLPQRGATTIGRALTLAAAPRDRYSHKRALAEHLPGAPGVYLLRAHDGEVLRVTPAENLRRHALALLRPGRRRSAGVARELAALRQIDHEVCGSPFEAELRALELRTEFSVTGEGQAVGGCYLALQDVGCLEVSTHPTLGGLCVGPLPSHRAARAAVATLNAAYLAGGAHGGRVALARLLRGDVSEFARLPERIAEGEGCMTASAARDGSDSPRALLSVLVALGRARALGRRSGVIIERAADGSPLLFCVAAGRLIARQVVDDGGWSAAVDEALGAVGRAEAAEAGLLSPLQAAQAELIDRRLAEWNGDRGDLPLEHGWRVADAHDALCRLAPNRDTSAVVVDRARAA